MEIAKADAAECESDPLELPVDVGTRFVRNLMINWASNEPRVYVRTLLDIFSSTSLGVLGRLRSDN